MSYQRKIFLLISTVTVLRLLFASATELSADEAYYWTYALKLQWNYFDHPPIVGWLIRLTTANLLLSNEVFVRLGAIISCGICTWLIFKIATIINNEQTGWFAALLYTSSIYCSIAIGANILPDSPQMVCWLSSILLLVKISRLTDVSKSTTLWCLFGLTAGLCIMCKVHGVFIWLGAALYILLIDRRLLKYKGFYIATLIIAVIISPIIIWNIQNGFITYKFHSSRVSPIGSALNLPGFAKAIFQEAVNNNPFNFFLICSSLFLAFKKKLAIADKELKLLLLCSLPLIAVVLILSLFKQTFANWPGPAYSTLLIFPAVKLASNTRNSLRIIPNVIKWAFAYLLIIALIQILSINYFPGTLSPQKTGPKTGTNDLTLDMYGWQEIGSKFDSLYKSDVSNKVMPATAPIIITNWTPGAAIEFYITNKTKQEVIGIGDVFDLHQYYWTNKNKRQLNEGDSAYYIIPSNDFYYRTSNIVNSNFRGRDTALVITQYRSGFICRYISVFRIKGFKNLKAK